MNKPRENAMQVNSDQIDGRLARIEDRVASVEAILAYANRKDIEDMVAKAVGNSAQRKKLLKLCETPQSIPALQEAMGLNSGQAVNNHLGPLRDNGLLQHATTQPEVTYEWSSILRRLTKAAREELLK